jgi:hypothetical protein
MGCEKTFLFVDRALERWALGLETVASLGYETTERFSTISPTADCI